MDRSHPAAGRRCHHCAALRRVYRDGLRADGVVGTSPAARTRSSSEWPPASTSCRPGCWTRNLRRRSHHGPTRTCCRCRLGHAGGDGRRGHGRARPGRALDVETRDVAVALPRLGGRGGGWSIGGELADHADSAVRGTAAWLGRTRRAPEEGADNRTAPEVSHTSTVSLRPGPPGQLPEEWPSEAIDRLAARGSRCRAGGDVAPGGCAPPPCSACCPGSARGVAEDFRSGDSCRCGRARQRH